MILLTLIVFLIVGVLVGCGSKSSETVTADLSKKIEKLASYRAQGTMTLQTGENPQVYNVEVWYKEPDFYRIALSNQQMDITQIILRNEEGVFVMTPHLNKSFRFQSDWPKSSGQVYLYHTLAADILADANRKFSNEETEYLFEVAANYQNRSLASQRIWLDRKDLTPNRVEVLDADGGVMVGMMFDNFELNPSFDKDAFDMERNMTLGAIQTLPTLAEEEQPQGDFGIIRPNYLPTGVQLVEEKEVNTGEQKVIVLKFGGEYQFTLTEQRPEALSVGLAYGEPVDLGFTVGVLSEGAVNSLHWTYNQVDYQLTGNLPAEEMLQVAQSVFEMTGK